MERYKEIECSKVFTIDQICKKLPHRYPFLLVDKVYLHEEGKSGIGKKNVTVNEPYFTGHFPENPVVPGVLIVESIAQTIAVVYSSKSIGEDDNTDFRGQVGYLGAVNIKFLKLVKPGDTLSIYVELESKIKNISSFIAHVYVENALVAKGSLTVTQNE